jgi:hypothetical protein
MVLVLVRQLPGATGAMGRDAPGRPAHKYKNKGGPAKALTWSGRSLFFRILNFGLYLLNTF